jgi:hypothetical protein
VDAQEQRAARETAETQLTAAQVEITTLKQKNIELQAQLSATSKVSFCVCSVTFTSHFTAHLHMLFNSNQSPSKKARPPQKSQGANSSQPKEDSEDTVAVAVDAVPNKKKRKLQDIIQPGASTGQTTTR